jgi:hypothetical protein
MKAAEGVFSRTGIAQKAGATLVMSWSRAFHVTITTPDGLMLRTLRCGLGAKRFLVCRYIPSVPGKRLTSGRF